jgi:hypothetical protein
MSNDRSDGRAVVETSVLDDEGSRHKVDDVRRENAHLAARPGAKPAPLPPPPTDEQRRAYDQELAKLGMQFHARTGEPRVPMASEEVSEESRRDAWLASNEGRQARVFWDAGYEKGRRWAALWGIIGLLAGVILCFAWVDWRSHRTEFDACFDRCMTDEKAQTMQCTAICSAARR